MTTRADLGHNPRARFRLQESRLHGVERFKREELQLITNRTRTPTPGTVNSYLVVFGAIYTLAEELGKIEKGRRR